MWFPFLADTNKKEKKVFQHKNCIFIVLIDLYQAFYNHYYDVVTRDASPRLCDVMVL